MFFMRLADLTIRVLHQYDYVKTLCGEYSVSPGGEDFCVSVTEADIALEGPADGLDRGYLEGLAIYRKIAEKMPDYAGFLMHGVILNVSGTGVALLAKSGVGKTTHAQLWQELLGQKVSIINGDKPLVRLKNGVPVAYGTPWAGKENRQKNEGVVLTKICFIERAEENSCTILHPREGLLRLLPQLYRAGTEEGRQMTLNWATMVAERVSFYVIRCNTELSAAEVAYEGIMP